VTADLRTRLQSSLGTAYTLERELGGGGMSRVFLAEDAALGRRVVVKVLAPELAEGLSAERFTREIRLAARLQHPNVVPVLAAGSEPDGLPYYTMPFIDGASLRERLAAGPLPLPEAVAMLRDVARALAYAHAHGVVHRDIKPENVLLTGGAAVVADFGIAKAISAAGGAATLTQVGMAVGTPAYMAPEQATGADDVDHRADLYAWGLIGWEALAGRHPFADRTSALALIGAHLTQLPAPLGAVRTGVPPGLAALVARCLAKDPAERPGDAAEVLRALDSVGLTPAAPVDVAAPVPWPTPAAPAPRVAQDRSLVVLPFANLSPDPDNGYFSDGLTEELIADLSRVRALRVISRTSAMRFKSTDRDARQVAEALGVRYVLEGSVRKAGTQLRITARLVDAMADAQCWADKYAGTLDDVFDLQERVSREIVQALDVTLSAEEDRSLATRPAGGVAAYDCYLRAKHEIGQASAAGLDHAERLLDQGLATFGADPLLRATRAHLRVLRLRLSGRPDAAQLDAAAAEGEAILHEHPGLDAAHLLLGAVEFERGCLPQAADHLRQVLAVAPGDVEARFWYGLTCLYAGHIEAVRAAGDHLKRRDPLSPTGWALECSAGWYEGDFAAAVAPMARSLELSDDSTIYRWMWGYGLALAGRNEDAAVEADRLARTDPLNPYTWQLTALTRALRGDLAGAEAALRPCEGLWFDHHMAFHMAEGFALLGRVDRALALLEGAVARGFSPYAFIARHNPFLDAIRDDPRFAAVVAEAERRWRVFAV
jgi:eukaryotic-like serine/threonine-protein kinase